MGVILHLLNHYPMGVRHNVHSCHSVYLRFSKFDRSNWNPGGLSDLDRASTKLHYALLCKKQGLACCCPCRENSNLNEVTFATLRAKWNAPPKDLLIADKTGIWWRDWLRIPFYFLSFLFFFSLRQETLLFDRLGLLDRTVAELKDAPHRRRKKRPDNFQRSTTTTLLLTAWNKCACISKHVEKEQVVSQSLVCVFVTNWVKGEQIIWCFIEFCLLPVKGSV